MGAAGWSRGVQNTIFVDFGMILGRSFDSLLGTEAGNFDLFSRCDLQLNEALRLVFLVSPFANYAIFPRRAI